MSQSEVVRAQTVDLTNCDEEPIHIPGSIQPHGLLFVLKEPQLQIKLVIILLKFSSSSPGITEQIFKKACSVPSKLIL